MNHSDFGRYLSTQRELRGMSRAEVAQRTKIPPTLLEALEEGEERRLPDRVFVMHWVRAYAQVIGLEPNEAVLRYEEVAPRPGQPESLAAPPQREVSRRLTWVVALLLFVVLVAWLVLRNRHAMP